MQLSFFFTGIGCVELDFYQNEETNLLRRTVCWIVDIIVVIFIARFLIYGAGTQITISGHSMLPSLKSEDVVLMDRLAYDFGSPKRFDVIAFQRDDDKINVKRVIGLPGETVQIKNGIIYIDDMPLEAENDLNRVSLAGLAENPVKLADNEYFVLGDNREGSEDSRFTNIGNVKKKQILGRVWLKLYPLIEIEFVK
ncbi:signal peptidase I [Clostridium sp. MCC353]|nr:signal peptidase I [Clostridium sp. MCC353]